MAVEKELLEGIALIAEGKEEGFNILYSHTYKYVYSRAKYIMKNEEDALDLTQETFIQAYKGIHALEDANNVYAWLGGIVYRQGMKIFRQKKDVLVNQDSEGIFDNILDGDKDVLPEESMQAKATSEIVMSMVNELPELQRAAIVAFYYDNMKIEEIAQVFECSANTIKSRLNYAKKFLKTKVEEHERQNRYKLCAVSPAILVMSFKSLFATKEYCLSRRMAKQVYGGVCRGIGLASAATGGGILGTVASKAGMLLGSKLGVTVAAVVTAGTVCMGAYVVHSVNEPHKTEAQELIEKVEEELDRRGRTESNVLDIDVVVSGVTPFSYEDNALNERAQKILSEIITADMTEFFKVKAIHDYILMNVDYDYDDYLAGTIPGSSYTAEGPLDTGYGVCAGYAKLFKLLCNNAGIECDYVVGWVRAGLHAWNQVKVDGNWYNIDVTWDDPVDMEKEFDDHLSNHYSYFLLSDEDMYKDHTAYNAKHECTAPSIGNSAFEYGCPWLDSNPSAFFVKNYEELSVIIQKVLDEKIMAFEVITTIDGAKDEVHQKITEFTVKAGYNWHAISRSRTISFASGALERWSLIMYQEPKKFEYFTSEEDVKEFILAYVAQNSSNGTMAATWTEVSYYAPVQRLDAAALREWALLNGANLLMGEDVMQEIVPGYYYSVIGIAPYGHDVLTSAEEITSNIQAAYDRGEADYVFLYDYRNTGMTPNEALYTIIYATPEHITQGHSVLVEDVEGLMLFCQYFRR